MRIVRTATDAKAIADSGAVLVFTPEIKTTSSSPSPFSWPPTVFSIEIKRTNYGFRDVSLAMQRRSVPAKLIPTSAGTTRSGSQSPSALSAPLNTGRVSDLRDRTSPSCCPHPSGGHPRPKVTDPTSKKSRLQEPLDSVHRPEPSARILPSVTIVRCAGWR